MRILIVGIPRSGTTSVYNSIKSQYSELPSFYEPWFWRKNGEIDIDSYKDLLIKTLIYQKPNPILKRGYQLIDCLDFYREIVPKFDKVILLSRRNLNEAAVSYDYAFKSKNWQTEYSTDSLPKQWTIHMYEVISNRIEVLGNEFNLKVWYYEDLFNVNNINTISSFITDNDLEIKNEYIFSEYYNIKNKLRK
jgi:hypothetical protein